MQLSTVRLLANLNRRFYEEHAESFADSRPRLQPGVRRILGRIGAGARVLEVGCGDGQVARALRNAQYTGIDQSAGLLERARSFATKDERRRTKGEIAFVLGDVLSAESLPPGPYDFILAFAVFHHLPGGATRERVLQQLARRLAPGGSFVFSNWQFHRGSRFHRLRAPWSTIGLNEADVEPGDALLTWERKGQPGLRYVHALDEAEARGLATGAGLAVTEVFTSDGHTGDLAEYVVMSAAS
jgi:tRNA (uracil-5-)-methyltransferase TRM9